jgi:hypothetical protein
MPQPRYPAIGGTFCAVKVKLTKRLAIGPALLGSAHSIARRVSLQGPARSLHKAASNKFGRRAGRVAMSPEPCAEKISTDEGGLSQSPPVFVFIELFTVF